MAEFNKARSIVVGPGRLSFPSLFKARQQFNALGQPEGVPKFEATILLPPTTDLSAAYAALYAAAQDKFGQNPQNWPPKIRDVRAFVRKCDEVKSLAQHAGWWFISARSKDPVGVIDTNNIDIKDEQAAYAGRWCWLSVAAFGFQLKTNLGLSFGLNAVMLGRHDEKLSGRPDAQTQFKDMQVPDDMKAGVQAGPTDWTPQTGGNPWGQVQSTPAWAPQPAAPAAPASAPPWTPPTGPKGRPDLGGVF